MSWYRLSYTTGVHQQPPSRRWAGSSDEHRFRRGGPTRGYSSGGSRTSVSRQLQAALRHDWESGVIISGHDLSNGQRRCGSSVSGGKVGVGWKQPQPPQGKGQPGPQIRSGADRTRAAAGRCNTQPKSLGQQKWVEVRSRWSEWRSAARAGPRDRSGVDVQPRLDYDQRSGLSRKKDFHRAKEGSRAFSW